MKRFALIGAAGYIAPRHMKAIRDTGNLLIAAYDPNDSVGILDSYFPDTRFFTEFERFDRYIDKLRRQGNPIDFISICSPNYLHDAHIRYGIKSNCDVICEKPIVLNPWNLDAIQEMEIESKHRVYSILQLRLHPQIIALKQKIDIAPKDKKHQVDLEYITPRGNWYHHSWKGDLAKSGGIATNIGIHFFDMLIWLFGNVLDVKVTELTSERAIGSLIFQRAEVNWKLSIDVNDLPPNIEHSKAYRRLTIDEEKIEFSEGFTDLHTESYRQIIAGKGFSLSDSKPSIDLVYKIRNSI